jgi:hypothetical protein
MLFKVSNNLVQIYRSFSITRNYGRQSFSKYGISYYNVVALPRHKFVTGATLLQLGDWAGHTMNVVIMLIPLHNPSRMDRGIVVLEHIRIIRKMTGNNWP